MSGQYSYILSDFTTPPNEIVRDTVISVICAYGVRGRLGGHGGDWAK